MIIKYIEVNYPPFSTLFESLMFFAMTTALTYILVERVYKSFLMGFLTNIFLLGIIAYAYLKKDIGINPLPPALQSVWFIPHVAVYFFGYGALAIAFISAIIYSIKPNLKLKLYIKGKYQETDFYEIMSSLIIFGFILLTIGLIVGAFWAKEAWGDYWSWDPKENWALITILVYAIYFHLKKTKNWTHRKLAKIIIIGFITVMFTYLGMSLLPTSKQSAHVYIED
jgi:cytochrome c-type biogenesis protein CcsB